MGEAEIEKIFKKRVEKRGAKALKFVSPGMAGVPDRLVLIPGGRMLFVELKRPGEKLRLLQVKRAKELTALGFKIYCIDSVEAVDDFIQEVFRDDLSAEDLPRVRDKQNY